MPIAQLLCEGGNHSPDARVLSKLLAGVCQILPCGGKYGMGERILAKREILRKNDTVFGILDGDFKDKWSAPQNVPQKWESKDQRTHFGWRWERKEIENYLIDPIVVEKALGKDSPNMISYNDALDQAKTQIAFYESARIALSTNRLQLKNLPSNFGRPRGKEKHLFPDDLTQSACKNEIIQVLKSHNSNQTVSEDKILTSFHVLTLECNSSGCRYVGYLQAFAGKDLFWAMNDWLSSNKFGGAAEFRERILMGISKTNEEIANWIPEWKKLKEILAK